MNRADSTETAQPELVRLYRCRPAHQFASVAPDEEAHEAVIVRLSQSHCPHVLRKGSPEDVTMNRRDVRDAPLTKLA